jgi:organic hydroperoxide reductase OsmC/OhrA
MSAHHATVLWTLDDGDFRKRRYSRAHRLIFNGGVEIPGSPATAIVPLPFSREDAADPESMFTASLSACHMMWFLDLAARGGFTITEYRDEAEGELGKMPATGKMGMTKVTLRPKITFTGEKLPTAEDLARLHHAAHEACFIANSVTTEVVVE